jgi:hypothetical protein
VNEVAPGLVVVRLKYVRGFGRRFACYSLTHERSGLGLRVAGSRAYCREIGRRLAGLTDWTRPAEALPKGAIGDAVYEVKATVPRDFIPRKRKAARS